MTIEINSAAVLTGALLLGIAASGTAAAASRVDRAPTRVAEAMQAQPAAGVDTEEPATCSKSRKRLWVEGEGWIVRRITTCR